jgi:hypothetical protein
MVKNFQEWLTFLYQDIPRHQFVLMRNLAHVLNVDLQNTGPG